MDTLPRAQDVKTVSASRIKAARVIAVSADALQLFFFPLFAEGFVSVLDDALDLLVCAVMTILVGWHYSFLPSFIVKVVPFADLVPTWTIAVFLATRRNQTPQETPETQVYSDPPAPPLLKSAAEK
jgi:hypothetical protein